LADTGGTCSALGVLRGALLGGGVVVAALVRGRVVPAGVVLAGLLADEGAVVRSAAIGACVQPAQSATSSRHARARNPTRLILPDADSGCR
jgi:hypothetical protein